MAGIREAIDGGSFQAFRARFFARYAVLSVTLGCIPEGGHISEREA
jgi:hypothetical protein